MTSAIVNAAAPLAAKPVPPEIMLGAALSYAERGLAVVPYYPPKDGRCTCKDGAECKHAGKHPWTANGFNDASTDPATIEEWWRCRPGSNIGIMLSMSNLFALDVDVRHKGDVTLAGLEAVHGPLPRTVQSLSGGGGRHILFQHPGGTIQGGSNKLGPGLDVICKGAVVAPPSLHASGQQYVWEPDSDPGEVAVSPAPEWLLALLRPAPRKPAPAPAAPRLDLKDPRTKAYVAKAIENELAAVRSPEPGRNSRLNVAAFNLGTLIPGGYVDRATVESELTAAAMAAGLGLPEIVSTLRSGIEAGIAQPRHVDVDQEYRPMSKPTTTAKDAEGEREILIGIDESRVVTETVTALTFDKAIYQRGGVLVRIRRDAIIEDGVIRPAGAPTIQVLPAANLRERMTRVARFTKINAKGDEVPSHPAAWLVAAVDVRGDWPGIRPLMAISDAPVLRADGTIWQTPGYDSATGVLFETNQTFPPVPEHPTIDHARRAVDELMEVVCDFPFEAPEHRAVWLAGLLTPPARFAFAGPAPLVLADANIAGAGKGLLIHCIARIDTGRDAAVSAYAHDGDEMRKRVTSIALAGDRLVLLDNIVGAFGNATLDRLLTAPYWQDRILGRNEEVTLPLTATWYATGNNVAIAADTARRCVHIRLDTMNEHPDQRADFRHPNLLAWVSENRPRLLTATLTILAAYFEAGCLSQGLTPYGSFEGWSNLVRQAVVWVGQPDPCKTRVQLMESADVTAGSLSQLIEAWREYARGFHGGGGLKVSEMVNRLYPADRRDAPGDPASVEMRAALEGITGTSAAKQPTAKQVAGRLRYFRRRPIDNHFLDIDESKDRAKGRTWVLQKVAP
jgi:hypothetical protein